ncbi:MAG TPA: hypothetical protein VG889_19560 [Rhizomicrobium sp.]|nr:hypothetical protein [Rhizomicrobium sp.]
MKRGVVFTLAVAIAVSMGMARYPHELSDAALTDYARKFHGSRDWSSFPKNGEAIGLHRGNKVVAEARCSDVCPDYTRLVIRYDAAPGEACRKAGGREVQVAMPFAIAVRNETFCVPEVLEKDGLYTAP